MGLTRIRAEQISDIDYKQAVRVITLSNVNLDGGAPSLVDGVSLVGGDRILVNGQSNAAQNGLYQVQTLGTGENGTWARTSDGNQDGEIQPGMVVMVTQGTQYADTPWKLITNGEIIIGTTELTFTENYSLAFGNIFAGGTAVIANTVSAPITFTAGENVSIIGNNITKTVTISATGGGGGGSTISNGTSNVTVVSSGGNVTVGIAGSQVAEFDSRGLDVTGNITTGNILTDGYYYANGEPFSGGGGSGTAIVNGTSNVDIATANANITMSVAGTSNVVVVSATGITVQGNVVGNGIPITTVSATPPADPEQGDIWIDSDTAIQYIYFTAGGVSQWAEMEAQVSVSGGTGGSGTPGGSNTQIQFNDANTFGGSPALTFDKVTNAVSITGTVTAQDFVTPVSVISSNTSATSGTLYVFTDTLTLTLPASPAVGDSVFISNRSNQTDCIINRNSSNIMGSSENLQVNVLNAAFELVYVNPSQGWILL